MRRLLTAHDVARLLSCNYRHVHRLRKRGVLPAVDITANTPEAEESRRKGAYRFVEADVQAYIDQQRAVAA